MKKKLLFEKFLNKRKQLSESNKNKKQIVSANDSQLIDILKNFNESNEYKSIKNNK